VIVLALWLAATADSSKVLIDEVVPVEAGRWRAFPIGPARAPVTLECQFQVVDGADVRVSLLSREEAEHFRFRRDHSVVASTGDRSGGVLRHPFQQSGDYLLIVDTRGPRRAAQVRLRVALIGNAVVARDLPVTRRWTVVLVSLTFFAGVGVWSGRRLWRGTRSLPEPGRT